MLLHLKKRFSQKDEHWRWSWREVGLKCKSGEIWPPPAAEEILAPLCREIHLRFPLGNPHFLSIEVGSFMKIVLSPWRTFMYTAFPQWRQHLLKGRKFTAPWWFLLAPRLKCISKSWWSINKISSIDWNIAILYIGEEIKKEPRCGNCLCLWKYSWPEMAVMQVLTTAPWGAVMQTRGHHTHQWSPDIQNTKDVFQRQIQSQNLTQMQTLTI